ncbi:flavodoxin family protein [Sulfurospirillum arsenophilum]|uniref:flavodoxin family protein n=1 Tax=Sulfurospirillum arsenophilum TaxID=56698 RepID=UPI0005A79832|nr:flavodoxin family protein [Sulfurospirillum arsenophilum]
MNVLLVNGSPRKNFNTAKLLNKALEGAISAGADVEIINLYDYTFQGCLSCFACKIKGSKTNGLCAHKDELKPILKKAQKADVIILGTPVYYDYPTAQMRAFMERFMFPVDTYMINPETKERIRFHDKIVPTGIIYTMNCPEFLMKEIDYPTILNANGNALNRLFGYCETLYSYDTYQYTDYAKYDCNIFDEKVKAEIKERQFPLDCEKAFAMGKKLVEMVNH